MTVRELIIALLTGIHGLDSTVRVAVPSNPNDDIVTLDIFSIVADPQRNLIVVLDEDS